MLDEDGPDFRRAGDAGRTRVELLAAQERADALFHAIEERGLVRAGESESAMSEAIFKLGAEAFGVTQHWHRRVVRVGPNTRLQFRDAAPDRVAGADDIVSLDLGPVFGAYEADFGRTYVLGNDPAKLRLRDDLAVLFDSASAHYRARPSMTGAELYAHVVASSAARGWGFGGSHAGHLVGPFALPRAARDAAVNRIRPDNDRPMNAPDAEGKERHWILEIHLLDPTGAFGGFYEQLLV
jgi:Xaa-Pro dipeptidase